MTYALLRSRLEKEHRLTLIRTLEELVQEEAAALLAVHKFPSRPTSRTQCEQEAQQYYAQDIESLLKTFGQDGKLRPLTPDDVLNSRRYPKAWAFVSKWRA